MKKSLLLILAAALTLLAFTACKDNEENVPSSTDTTSSVEEGTTESTEIQSTATETEEGSTEAESTEAESTESETEGGGFETDENGNINLPEIPW